MTKTEANTLQAKIETLRASAARQINVEMEGQHPEYDLPQQIEADRLQAELNAAGYCRLNGQLWSATEVQAIREAFNGNVKSYMSANPGQQVPSAKLQGWEKEAGMTLGSLKTLVSVLGL